MQLSVFATPLKRAVLHLKCPLAAAHSSSYGPAARSRANARYANAHVVLEPDACALRAFDAAALRSRTKNLWLSFAGDSSLRGLYLSLLQQLMDEPGSYSVFDGGADRDRGDRRFDARRAPRRVSCGAQNAA